jgi:hypothetical protein
MNLSKNPLCIFTFIVAIAFAPNTFASMLINFKTSFMQWQEEYTDYTDSGEYWESTFFSTDEIQLDVSFIVPDFELATGQNQYLTFYNPVASVKTSNFFDSFTIDDGGHFWLELSADDTIQMWSFEFSITETNNPTTGATRRGEFASYGWLTSINEGVGAQDQFMFYQDNWPYIRQGNIWNSDTVARFGGESFNSKMTLEKISLPEPHSAILLLTALMLALGIKRLKETPYF